MKSLFAATVICTVFFAICAAVFLPKLLLWMSLGFYASQTWLLKWLLVGCSFYALSMIPHYGLYALQMDRQIVLSQIVSLVAFLVITGFLSDASPSLAVPIGLVASFAILLIWKSVALVVLALQSYKLNLISLTLDRR